MLAAELPVGLGTDATRVASYNPWTALYWLVSGRTIGGMAMYDDSARLDRETALMLWTQGSARFSTEQGKKGQIKVGQLADVAVLSQDYFSVPEEQIKGIESVMTVVDGKVVYAAGSFAAGAAAAAGAAGVVAGHPCRATTARAAVGGGQSRRAEPGAPMLWPVWRTRASA